MQIHRTADPERRSHLLKKVTTSRTGFNPLLPGRSYSNERIIANALTTPDQYRVLWEVIGHRPLPLQRQSFPLACKVLVLYLERPVR